MAILVNENTKVICQGLTGLLRYVMAKTWLGVVVGNRSDSEQFRRFAVLRGLKCANF